ELDGELDIRRGQGGAIEQNGPPAPPNLEGVGMTKRRTMRRWTIALATLMAGAMAVLPVRAIDDGARAEQAARYKALVAKLAGDEFEGRGTGSAGIAKARDFIIAHFKDVGLQPAVGDKYTQGFRCPIGGKITKFHVALTDADGKTHTLKPGRDVGPLPLTGGARFQGGAVFVGYGAVNKARDYDSYARVKEGELKGKVLVMFRYEPHDANGQSLWTDKRSAYGMWTRSAGFSTKLDLARKHKAAAVLIVNPPAHNKDNGPSLPETISRMGRSGMPILQLSLDRFRALCKRQGLNFDALKQRADAGAGRPVALGVTVAGELKVRRASVACDNVVGVLPGAGKLKEEVVVIGAHYDHLGSRESGGRKQIFHGADDNASGTAGVMVLAERMARYAAKHKGDRRTMVFAAFAAEERGLVGSGHMVSNLRELGIDANDVTAMLNFDMIGRVRKGRLHVWGVDSGEAWRTIVAEAGKRSSLKLKLVSSGSGPSDHASFYRAKIPVLAFNTGMHGDLHRPSDTIEKINPDGALSVLSLAGDILKTVATRDEPIAYRAPRKGKNVYLGVAPGRATGGFGIGRVVPDGPADQAGLQAGDVITAIGDHDVTDAFTLRATLRKFKPGQTVLVTLRRDGESKTLNVTLGSR
ncbi:MAG: M28 family peptidase, partial [Phycisphaerae bacterium]